MKTFTTESYKKTPKTPTRSISTISYEILKEWKKPHYTAIPYLNAMTSLDTVNDNYGMDSAKTIILYFLNNASSFRGEKAREIKKELKALIK